MVERQEGRIHIGKVEPEIFEKVVKFMYEQNLKFDHEKELEGVLDAADRFDFKELKTKVNKMVKDALGKDNVLTTAGLAELYNAKELLASCIKVMVRLEVRLEAGYVARWPGVALALVEYWRQEAGRKSGELAEKEEKLRNREEEVKTLIEGRGRNEDYGSSDDESYWNNASWNKLKRARRSAVAKGVLSAPGPRLASKLPPDSVFLGLRAPTPSVQAALVGAGGSWGGCLAMLQAGGHVTVETVSPDLLVLLVSSEDRSKSYTVTVARGDARRQVPQEAASTLSFFPCTCTCQFYRSKGGAAEGATCKHIALVLLSL